VVTVLLLDTNLRSNQARALQSQCLPGLTLGNVVPGRNFIAQEKKYLEVRYTASAECWGKHQAKGIEGVDRKNKAKSNGYCTSTAHETINSGRNAN
jgi:hypothetical protein